MNKPPERITRLQLRADADRREKAALRARIAELDDVAVFWMDKSARQDLVIRLQEQRIADLQRQAPPPKQ